MTWQEETIPMLRVLIDDNDPTNYGYTDDRLEEILVVAAKYVTEEVNNIGTYTVNVSSTSISPDPDDDADTTFINFMVLKAACLTDWSTYRQKALVAGVKAKCGPAVLETLQHLEGFRTLITKGPCESYTQLRQENNFNGTTAIRAVLSPFRGNNFDPSFLRDSYTRRSN